MATIRNRSQRWAIWDRDGGICGICNERVSFEKMELDHIQPRSLGGPDTPENLRPSHQTCNGQRKAKLDFQIVRPPLVIRPALPYYWPKPKAPAPPTAPPAVEEA